MWELYWMEKFYLCFTDDVSVGNLFLVECKQRIKSAEMVILILVARYRLIYKKRSEDVRRTLGLFNLNQLVNQYRCSQEEHRYRMVHTRTQKGLLNYKPRRRTRCVERPNKRWNDDHRSEKRIKPDSLIRDVEDDDVDDELIKLIKNNIKLLQTNNFNMKLFGKLVK